MKLFAVVPNARPFNAAQVTYGSVDDIAKLLGSLNYFLSVDTGTRRVTQVQFSLPTEYLTANMGDWILFDLETGSMVRTVSNSEMQKSYESVEKVRK